MPAGWAQEIALRLLSYIETSPSGTGAKVFFRYCVADLPALQKSLGVAADKYGRKFSESGKGKHPPGVEIYLKARYFAVTGLPLTGSPQGLRLVPAETLAQVIDYARTAFGDKRITPGGGGGDGSDRASDPVCLPVDDADLWTRVGEAATRRPGLAAIMAGDFSRLNDKSRSAKAFRLVGELRADQRFTKEECMRAVRLWPETAGWAAESDKRQFDNLWSNNEPGAVDVFQAEARPPGGRELRTEHWRSNLAVTDAGKIIPTIDSVRLVLQTAPEFDGVFRWNAFSSAVEIVARPPWECPIFCVSGSVTMVRIARSAS